MRDVAKAGGKGASLGEMTKAGIPVPPGFVLLASAFERFIEETDLDVEIDATLDAVNHKEMHSIENASEKIQALILGAQMPHDVEKDINKNFNQLDAQWVAVRSSATAEDSSTAAWAGQLDSFLNTDKRSLLANIKKCWASLFTPRAIFYRFEKGLHKQKISVAVVVQKMVQSEVSGIAFSVHPVTQDRNQLIIEAGFGLGEAIVSGQITPDSYVVEKNPWRIIDKNISIQGKALCRAPRGGNVWQNIPKQKGARQVLSDKEIGELAELLIGIERHYGFPVDVEWARENSKFFIVQSRPITTLKQKKIPSTSNKNKAANWQKLLAREGVDITTISQIDLVFYDLIWQATGKKLELFFTFQKGRDFTHYIGLEPKVVGRFIYDKYFRNPTQIVKYYNEGKKFLKNEEKLAHDFEKRLSKQSTREKLLTAFLEFRKGFEQINYIYSIVSWIGIEAWQADFEELLNGMIRRNKVEKRTEQVLATVYKPWKKTALIEIQEKLAQGVNHSKIVKDYQFLRSWSAVWYKPLTEEWIKSLDTTNTTKRPSLLSKPQLRALLKPNKEERDFIEVAPYIVFFKDWRDDARRNYVFHWSFLFGVIADHLGVVRDDLGYLTIEELADAITNGKCDLGSIERRKHDGCIVTKRKDRLDIEVIDEGVPNKYFSIIDEVDARGREGMVKGTVAQPGMVQGTAKIVRSYHDIKRIVSGDILVANTTHPDYLPAMQRAAAFVTNEGGMISHAAIVAREMKKPCIVGTGNATKIIQDGDFIEVNATDGVVRVLSTFRTAEADDLVSRYGLDKSTWTYKGFHAVLHTFFPLGDVTRQGMKDLWGKAPDTIFFFKENYIHWYWNDNDLTRMREEFFNRLRKNKKFLEELKTKWQAKLHRFDESMRSIDRTDLKKLPKGNLAKLYDDFYSKYTDEYKDFMSLGDAISMHADRYLVPIFEKILGSNFATVFPKLLTPQYFSFVEEENMERSKLLDILRKKRKIDPKLLQKHADKFFYIQNNYAKGVHLTAKDFELMLKDDLKKGIRFPKDLRTKNLSEKQALIRKYKLSEWEKTLLYVMDEFFMLQDIRKKYVLISCYYLFKFLHEAARRTSIDFKLLCYSVPPEFRSVLDKKIKIEALRERNKLCAIVHSDDTHDIITGKAAESAFKFFQKDLSGEQEIKGMTASPGKVRGRVKKILKIHDMINMDEGDILVSSMTRPEMVPAMKLAAGIITDEGGVTSHAAIVSREMGIPCVIGTKIATQVLKDGDLVEVDADHGTVRVLNKA